MRNAELGMIFNIQHSSFNIKKNITFAEHKNVTK